jgi:glycosyltransferase involved in cell wall biosynthesis
VTPGELPSFDLIVATVDRTQELGRLLESLEGQTYRGFRVLVVDQNDDERLGEVIGAHGSLSLERVRAPRGLSRSRNAALSKIKADLVAFPDDDCRYPSDLLERVARRFAADRGLGGLTGRSVDAQGHSSGTWPLDAAEVTRENIWHRAISYTVFLRASAVRAIGSFDEQLGLGSGTSWSSGEETEYLVRAVDAGVRVQYDPELTVEHAERTFSSVDLQDAGAREGASVGYILRKHSYRPATVGRMVVRPLGGALAALARRDRTRAGFHLATLRGRVRGYLGSTSSRNSSS